MIPSPEERSAQVTAEVKHNLLEIRRSFLNATLKTDRTLFFVWVFYVSVVLLGFAASVYTNNTVATVINGAWVCLGVFFGQRAWRNWRESARELAALDVPERMQA